MSISGSGVTCSVSILVREHYNFFPGAVVICIAAGGEDWEHREEKNDQRRDRNTVKWNGEISVTKQWWGDGVGRGAIDTPQAVQDPVECFIRAETAGGL